jgi:hypothetical protein
MFIKCLKDLVIGKAKSRIDRVIIHERDKPGKGMLGKAPYEKLVWGETRMYIISKRERAPRI